MPRKPVTLVTGAGGEIGHALIPRLAAASHTIITLDLKPLPADTAAFVHRQYTGDISGTDAIGEIANTYKVREIFHLAALLSTSSERSPALAHKVNVGGTLNMLDLANEQAASQGERVKMLFPSTIAVYGLPDRKTKNEFARIKEHQWQQPTTMYGCNKLYCEHLGRYMARYSATKAVDFRCVRLPGLISADTLPTGGTSDFGPEMLHAAAQGKPYECFVAEDTRIPFMAMPDAVDGILRLMAADAATLTQTSYNIGAFNPSAAEFAQMVLAAFPAAQITYKPNPLRQAICDAWPADVDDAPARSDFGHYPAYDLRRAFDDYLVPAVRRRYGLDAGNAGR